MKYLLIILTLFAYQIYSQPLAEETTIFCEIKDQQILYIEEGIPKKYSGYSDAAQNGDTVKIVVEYGLKKFNIETPEHKPMTLFSMGWTDSYAPDRKSVQMLKIIDNYSVVSAQTDIQLNEDYMVISDNVLNRNFSFERYYKNDWQMTFSNTTSGYTAVANCMNQSGFQRILAFYDKHIKK